MGEVGTGEEQVNGEWGKFDHDRDPCRRARIVDVDVDVSGCFVDGKARIGKRIGRGSGPFGAACFVT